MEKSPISSPEFTPPASAVFEPCTASSFPAPIRAEEEQKLLRKCDWHVLPMIFVLYLLAFVDRINIGNAKIEGLQADLNMTGTEYNIALFIFFIPYILFEIPSNIVIRKLAPSTWLSLIMVVWGIINVCMGLTRSYAGLVVCRFFLGFFEAGFFPGCIYLISMYYKRCELQWRINIFFCAAILAGAFGGILAFGIANMAGDRNYSGWRWIFIIEGVATTLIGAASKLFIVDWPESAKFLNSDERDLLLRRLAEDVEEVKMDRLDRKAARRVFGDWKIYAGTVMYFGIVNTGYSVSFFTPTILKQLGWTSYKAQYLSIPIYVTAAVVTLSIAILSDKLCHRYGFAMLGIAVATVGYGILLATDSVAVPVRYFALYMVTVGGYITQPIVLAWLANNMGGHYKRSISTAMQIGLGNAGGIVASNIFISNEAPSYPVGYGVSLGMLWLCGIACTILFIGLRLENRKRERGGRDDRYTLDRDELENLGDDHPRFRYTY